LFRAGEWKPGQDITQSEFHDVALAYLNRAYLGIANGGGELIQDLDEDWLWQKNTTPGLMQVFPAIGPGVGTAPDSVNATFNMPEITFNGMIGEGFLSLAGWEIRIGTNPNIYRINAHTINTGFATLDAGWGGPTGTYTYVTGKLEYPLVADVMRVVGPMRTFWGNDQHECHLIHEVDREHLYGYWPLACADGGMPEAFARITETQVRFNRYAAAPLLEGWTTLYRVEYDYMLRPTMLTAPGLSEAPLVPWEWRRVLADWALLWLLTDKNDSRAEGVGMSAKAGLQSMAHKNSLIRRSFDRSPSFGQIFPRAECYGRHW
jgi:hypothetical protein